MRCRSRDSSWGRVTSLPVPLLPSPIAHCSDSTHSHRIISSLLFYSMRVSSPLQPFLYCYSHKRVSVLCCVVFCIASFLFYSVLFSSPRSILLTSATRRCVSHTQRFLQLSTPLQDLVGGKRETRRERDATRATSIAIAGYD